jgi:hypothetical protein
MNAAATSRFAQGAAASGALGKPNKTDVLTHDPNGQWPRPVKRAIARREIGSSTAAVRPAPRVFLASKEGLR